MSSKTEKPAGSRTRPPAAARKARVAEPRVAAGGMPASDTKPPAAIGDAGRERVLVPVAPGSEGRPRRTQAERSRLTRERVMLATVELLRIRGYGELSTVEVTERAGVSRGAMLHQFPTKNELLIETMRYLNERMLEASAARAERAREREGDPLDAIIEDAFDFFFGDYFFITLSISMSDERNEDLRRGVDPLTGPSRIRIERRWVDVLVHAGWPRDMASDVLALTFSIVRGFAVRRLIQDDRKRFADLMGVWKTMVTDHVRPMLPPLAGPPQESRRRRKRA